MWMIFVPKKNLYFVLKNIGLQIQMCLHQDKSPKNRKDSKEQAKKRKISKHCIQLSIAQMPMPKQLRK